MRSAGIRSARHIRGGFTVAAGQATSLDSGALEQAPASRGPHLTSLTDDGLRHRADRGMQDTRLAFSKRLQELGIAATAGKTGTALDNAAMEATIVPYKTELISTKRCTSRQDVETATAAWVTWFNERRLHSALGYQRPTNHGHSFHRDQRLRRRAA